MQTYTITRSESVIGSLCREVESIRCRGRSISNSILNSKDGILISRLNSEFKLLQKRRFELINSVNKLRHSELSDNLSLDFLNEILKRGLI